MGKLKKPEHQTSNVQHQTLNEKLKARSSYRTIIQGWVELHTTPKHWNKIKRGSAITTQIG